MLKHRGGSLLIFTLSGLKNQNSSKCGSENENPMTVMFLPLFILLYEVHMSQQNSYFPTTVSSFWAWPQPNLGGL